MLFRVLMVVLALLALALVAVLLPLLRDRDAARRRIEALFRRSTRADKPLKADHYYRPYWS